MQTTATFDNANLFDAWGHLTDPGLRAITEGTLDELGRLEASEHLSFCDYCLARYTALIEAMPQRLQDPMRDLIPQVQALMRRRSFQILTNRYFSAVAAVVLCFTMWQFGVFGPVTTMRFTTSDPVAPKSSFSELVQQWSDGFDSMFDSWREFRLPTFSLFGESDPLPPNDQ